MSMQVNLSGKDLFTAYQDVINANGIDWALFTYDKGSNDLKVQSTGSGGLEELEEEFSDGRFVMKLVAFISLLTLTRIQYAFARVIDPNVLLVHLWNAGSYFDISHSRASSPSLYKSTGAETVCPRPRKAFSPPTRAQWPTSCAEPTS
jgi:hypothetical protein